MAVTRTTRLPDDLDSSLQALAKLEKVSVNFVINRSLRQLVDWDEFSRRFGLASVSLGLLSKLIDRLSVSELMEIGVWAATDQIKAYLMFSSKEVSLDALLNWFRLYSRYPGIFKSDYTVDKSKGRCVLILNHSLGLKGSAFFEAMLQSIFTQSLKIPIETSKTQGFCLATFALPNSPSVSD